MLPPLFELTDHIDGHDGTLSQFFLRQGGQAAQAAQCPPQVFVCHAATVRRNAAVLLQQYRAVTGPASRRLSCLREG
ncbi:hypothetical protein GCM10009578_059620 [Streptomyces rhizosphaericus]